MNTEAARAVPVSTLDPTRETVLLVDDDAPLRDLAQEVLEACGHRVLVAGRSEEAVRIGDRYQGAIDLLVTDLMLPEIGGRDLASRLVATRPGLQILYISGYGAPEPGPVPFTPSPEATFLAKPFTPAALVRAVREVLGRAGALAGAAPIGAAR